MSLQLPPPAHMPCSECGASVARGKEDAHRSEPERRLDYLMFELRTEVEGFDRSLVRTSNPPAAASSSGTRSSDEPARTPRA